MTSVKNPLIELDIMYSGLLKLCGAGFAAEAQRERATLGTSPASPVGSEIHVKVYARKENLLLSILAVLNSAWISGLWSP